VVKGTTGHDQPTSTAINSATPGRRVAAIPYPPGLSSSVAEEPHAPPHFTPREQQVGSWIAEGKTDGEIARILRIGLQTVKTHTKSLLDKTKLENRGAFIAWVWRDRIAVELQARTSPRPAKYK